jgi:hypothetical protein
MTFQPGESGNPAGRPRGARNKKTLLLEALLRKVLGIGRRSGDPAMRQLIERTLAPRPRKPIGARRVRQSSSAKSRAKRRVVLRRSKKPGGHCKYQRKYNAAGLLSRGRMDPGTKGKGLI